MGFSGQEIKDYWNKRAEAEAASGNRLTTNDWYLRELEAKTFIREITGRVTESAFQILDVGCGDGLTTIRVCGAIPGAHAIGVDYAAQMIQAASRNLQDHPELLTRLSFGVADALDLSRQFSDRFFDVILSDRCLINLGDYESQKKAFAEIASVLRPGGYYFAVENFCEGQDNMNRARLRLGLSEIPVRWHNLFFTEESFSAASSAGFENPEYVDFAGGYYYATRLVYAAYCLSRGEEPDYGHEIHRLAVDLPSTGQFSPIRMAILRRKSR